jgi:hypothetical protein
LLDLKIIALTIWRILKREGIDQPGMVGAPEFMGCGTVENYLGPSAAVPCAEVQLGADESRMMSVKGCD